jgi:hypothetical protein
MLLENKFKILLGGKIILVSGYFPTASTMQFSFIKKTFAIQILVRACSIIRSLVASPLHLRLPYTIFNFDDFLTPSTI